MTRDANDMLRAGELPTDPWEQAEPWVDPSPGDPDPSGAPKAAKPSQADLLVELGSSAELWHDGDQVAYVTFETGEGWRETHKLRSKTARRWLVGQHYAAHTKVPGSQAVTNALEVLEARAVFDGPEREAFLRVAHHGGRVYLDLVDDSWTVLEIDDQGWRVCSDPPVRFRRARGMRPLPRPARGGSLEELRELVNVPDDDDWILVLGWLVGALSRGPFVVLVVQGEPGAAKTTLSRMLRELIDPSKVNLRSAPRTDERDLAVAAGNGWVIGYDNLSGLPGWLSDALCRVATGGGFGTRQLYSDDEEALFNFTRPILVNGIDGVVAKPDLVERSSTLRLPRIPPDQRQDERELWARFERTRPRLLGALLDAVSCALRLRDQVHLRSRPRMADAATWVEAAAPALGIHPGAYVAALGGNQVDAVSAALEDDPLGKTLRDFLEDNVGWKGTASQLLAQLDGVAQSRPERWPKDARALSSKLTWLAPALRAVGIDFTRERGPGPRRERLLVFRLVQADADPGRQTQGGRTGGTHNPPEGLGWTQEDAPRPSLRHSPSGGIHGS